MKINIIFFALFILVLSACGGNNKTQNQNEDVQLTKAAKNKLETTVEHPGNEVYKSVCLVCHMADGSGVPGMHPPLANSDWVNGDKEKLIKVILNGMQGKIEVDGETYNSVMPPQANLTDQQIADVLTFVRSNFGNNASEITNEEVSEVRQANK